MFYFPVISNSNKLVSGATLLLFLKLSSSRKHSEYSKQYRQHVNILRLKKCTHMFMLQQIIWGSVFFLLYLFIFYLNVRLQNIESLHRLPLG